MVNSIITSVGGGNLVKRSITDLLDESTSVSIPPEPESNGLTGLYSADDILLTNWPKLVWAVPDLMPVGLSILAGRAKLGKSTLALQIGLAVSTGGCVLGREVEQGPVLYLALEDPARRLQERMKLMGWPLGTPAEFMTIGQYKDRIGDIRKGGRVVLENRIKAVHYRLVVIDTLSRAIYGKQNEMESMTDWLTPLQETAHQHNAAILVIDHHSSHPARPGEKRDKDPIADILGSTAKGAMVDTVLGLYRDPGKRGATLAIEGREVERKSIELFYDRETRCWQCKDSEADITGQQEQILEALENLSPARLSDIADAVGRNKGNVYKQLAELESKGKVIKVADWWKVVRGKETTET